MQGYQIKVTVNNSRLPIWRRILVPDKISFRDLDDIIEEAFGWTHEHMFSFYFREADENFTGTPIAQPSDSADMSIEGWLWEGCTFLYTYDFGDTWEHTVQVEKVFPYDKRYPEVIKAKGPNMIEDCGGICGFYDCLDQAEPFDMEAVNARFRTWDMKEIVEGEVYEDENGEDGWSILSDLDDLEDVWDMDVLEDGDFANGTAQEEPLEEEVFFTDLEDSGIDLGEVRRFLEQDETEEEFPEDEEIETLRWQLSRPARLSDVFSHYKKGELEIIARANGFARHGNMKKAELVEWLCGQLLDGKFLAERFSQASREETELFEEAIEEDGIRISDDLISSSLLLCTYGAYVGEHEFFRVPVDVEEKYRELATPNFLEKREACWTMRTCCDAAVYLYGVVPLAKLAEICEPYNDNGADEKELTDFIRNQIQGGAPYVLHDGFLMDHMLIDANMYRHVLKAQESCDYYIPESREEFFQYGIQECQEPDERTQFYLDYLQRKCRLDEARSLIAFYAVQEALRMNAGDDEILRVMKVSGCSLKSEKSRREAVRQSGLLNWHVRRWELKGHTPQEIRGGGKKVVSIFGETAGSRERKVYPNDPCPCGSGKKYKYCCGKK